MRALRDTPWPLLDDPRLRLAAGGVAALFAVLLVVDVVCLSGQPIHHGPVQWFVDGSTQEFAFDVDRVGQKHTVEIDTEQYRLALSWAVLDPVGREVFADSEALPHDQWRSGSFVPEVAGRYVVRVEREYSAEILQVVPLDNFSSRVTVGERRILRPLFELLQL